jgi:glycosyltransferase involved in cell wall biosynthesis
LWITPGLDVVIVNQSPSDSLLEAANRLARRGHSVTMMTGTVTSRPRPDITYVALQRYDNSTHFSRLCSWLAFTVQATARLATVPADAVVLVCTNPPIMPAAAAAMASLRRFAFVVRVLDVYPDVLEATGLRRAWPLRQLFAAVNRWSYGRAAAVMTLGRTMARTLSAYLAESKIHVVPEWAQQPTNPLIRASVAPDAPFVVLASGNQGLTHDISPLVEAAGLVSAERFRIVISCSTPERLARRIPSGRKIRLEPRLPDTDYQHMLTDSHAAFLAQKPGAENSSYPSRTLTYLAYALPIIAVTRRPSDLASLVDENACGIVVSPDEGAEGVAGAIRRLRSDPSAWMAMSRAAADAARSFDSERWAGDFAELIEVTAASHRQNCGCPPPLRKITRP